MTITFTARQVAQLTLPSFNRRVEDAIRSSYPTQSLGASTADLNAVFSRGRERAQSYGLHSEYAVASFLHVTWLFGEDFDQRIPIVRQILSDEHVAPESKAEALGNFAIAVFQLLDKCGGGLVA